MNGAHEQHRDDSHRAPKGQADERRQKDQVVGGSAFEVRNHAAREQPRVDADQKAEEQAPEHCGECIIGSHGLMTMRMLALSGIVLVAIAAIAVWSGRGPRDRELLREVYSPTFQAVPPKASIGETIAQLGRDLAARARREGELRSVAAQAGVVVISCLVALGVAFDFSRPRNSRNVDILLMLALGLMFFDIMRLARVRLTPVYWRFLDVVFITIFALNAALLMRALWRARRTAGVEPAWRPNLRRRPLAALAIALVACGVYVALAREPDDAGYFVNLGAQRFRERGRLPYGDPLLTATPGAAYGPLLYAAHVPFQFLIEPRPPNAAASSHPPLGQAATYYLPPPLATKLCTITFHLAGVMALFVVGRRLTGNPDVGWGLVALYASSAFVLGLGGQRDCIGGMTFTSHIAPAAATLVAFACLPSPVLAGVLLAASAGVGFYPAFMLPAWAGFYSSNRRRLVRFVAGFAVAAAVIAGSTWLMSRPADGHGRLGTILRDTFGHHTDPQGYGRSPFGFWGQRDAVRRWLATPLVGESGLTTPAYLLLFGLMALTFAIARGANASQLALLTAVIALASSMIKVQSTGTYVAWAYPFLLIGIFANGASRRTFD